ncbi:hypothetical protein L2E82_01969 [Cichorium intybus]|uniref:Uncharacterized protein n=1 Tax=Cichorium intybus TaxID=13427 RepID=A0ACB9H0B3_CICIN|nr:hypothetical protein L2E82_01969 [Cichorium intybus]
MTLAFPIDTLRFNTCRLMNTDKISTPLSPISSYQWRKVKKFTQKQSNRVFQFNCKNEDLLMVICREGFTGMKRSRNDDGSGSAFQLKQPIILESSGQPQIMNGGSGQKLKTNDALMYL